MKVARSVRFVTPDGKPLAGAQTSLFPAEPGGAKPPPSTARTNGLRFGAAGLNGAGAALSLYSAVKNVPGQVRDTVDAVRRGDVRGAVDSGSAAAASILRPAAGLGQTALDAVSFAKDGLLGQRLIGPGTRAAASTGIKAVGRFVPGANVALAAYDTYQAVKSWTDPNASTGRKVGDTITAAGSILAATNIPIVSQAGAVVSTVSSFLTNWWGG
jgi:hypothetical protein